MVNCSTSLSLTLSFVPFPSLILCQIIFNPTAASASNASKYTLLARRTPYKSLCYQLPHPLPPQGLFSGLRSQCHSLLSLPLLVTPIPPLPTKGIFNGTLNLVSPTKPLSFKLPTKTSPPSLLHYPNHPPSVSPQQFSSHPHRSLSSVFTFISSITASPANSSQLSILPKVTTNILNLSNSCSLLPKTSPLLANSTSHFTNQSLEVFSFDAKSCSIFLTRRSISPLFHISS